MKGPSIEKSSELFRRHGKASNSPLFPIGTNLYKIASLVGRVIITHTHTHTVLPFRRTTSAWHRHAAMSVRKEPAEGDKATNELAAKKVWPWPDESKLNATPATLLHRLRGPVTATDPRHDPPRRLNDDGSRGTDYVVGPVDVVVRPEGGTEVMADSHGHFSLWSFEQRVFDSRKRFKSAVKTHRDSISKLTGADAPKCRTWRHGVTSGSYPNPTGIQAAYGIPPAKRLKYFVHWGSVPASGERLATLNKVSLGDASAGNHWADCCLGAESSPCTAADVVSGGDTSDEEDDAADEALQREAWLQHGGSFVCGMLMVVVRGWMHRDREEWASVFTGSLPPPTSTDVTLALLYRALFIAWPAGPLAEWRMLDGFQAVGLVTLGMRIAHAVTTRGPPRFKCSVNSQLMHDAWAVELHRSLSVQLPVFTAASVVDLAADTDSDTDSDADSDADSGVIS